MIGRVEAIYIAPEARAPMFKISRAVVSATGLVGDRYEGMTGTHKTRLGNRHLTMIFAELIAEANKGLQVPFGWDKTRRQIVVSGFVQEITPFLEANTLIGKRLNIGDSVVAEVTEICTPCRLPDLAGISGFMQAFAGIRGGIRLKVIETGEFAEGDSVVLVE